MQEKQQFSLIHGYTFTFVVDGHRIEAWFSALSGREKVRVDGEVVANSRNLSTNSSNEFTIGSNCFSTTLEVVSLIKGPFVCTLSKDNISIQRQRLHFQQHSESRFRGAVLLTVFTVAGVAIGVLNVVFGLSSRTISGLFLAVFVLTIVLNVKTRKPAVRVEVEDVV